MAKDTPTTKAAEAYARLKALVLNGHFDNGQRLSEPGAAKLLGMGRGPVRDAIVRLESEGLLASSGQRRSRIVTYTEDQDESQLLERYELREQIEGGAARLAAMNMNGWQVKRLRALCEKMVRLRKTGTHEQRLEASAAFREYLLENCGNRLFLEVWKSRRLMPPMIRDPELEAAFFGFVAEHDDSGATLDQAIDAIEARDADLAEKIIKHRIEQATTALRQVVWGQQARPAAAASARSSKHDADGESAT